MRIILSPQKFAYRAGSNRIGNDICAILVQNLNKYKTYNNNAIRLIIAMQALVYGFDMNLRGSRFSFKFYIIIYFIYF